MNDHTLKKNSKKLIARSSIALVILSFLNSVSSTCLVRADNVGNSGSTNAQQHNPYLNSLLNTPAHFLSQVLPTTNIAGQANGNSAQGFGVAVSVPINSANAVKPMQNAGTAISVPGATALPLNVFGSSLTSIRNSNPAYGQKSNAASPDVRSTFRQVAQQVVTPQLRLAPSPDMVRGISVLNNSASMLPPLSGKSVLPFVQLSTDAKVHEIKTGSLSLDNGSILISLPRSKSASTIETPLGRLWLGKQGDVFVNYSNGVLRVMNLTSISNSVRLQNSASQNGEQTIAILPGYELVASNERLTHEGLTPADGIARRNSVLIGDGLMAVSELHLPSFIKSQPQLFSSSQTNSKLLSRVSKTAAILANARGSEGFLFSAPLQMDSSEQTNKAVQTDSSEQSNKSEPISGLTIAAANTVAHASNLAIGTISNLLASRSPTPVPVPPPPIPQPPSPAPVPAPVPVPVPAPASGPSSASQAASSSATAASGAASGSLRSTVLAAIPSINAGASVSARDLTPAGFNSHEIGVKQPEKSGNQTPPATKHETSGGSNSVDKNATPEKSNKAQDPAETSSSSIENNESGDGRKASVHPAQSRIPLNSARPSTVLSSERDNSLRKLIKNAGKLFSPSAAINNATENIRRFPEFTLIFGFIIGALMTISLVLARAALARAKELETLNKQLAALNQELSAARDQALEGSRLKSEFVANISHELRTPLSAVIGMNSLLLNTKLDEKQKQYAALAKDSAQSLLGIINDILDFSKIEAGRLEIQTVKFSLNSVLKEVCDVLAPVVQAKGLTLAAVADPELGDESISADPTRLRQILLNLTGNAAKFTSSGQILIRVAKTLDERGVPRARFSVIDTGIGISNEAQTRLFRPFVQADGSTTRRFGGTGLGLSISKHLVELMGGQISVESTEGKGSTFSFDLPFLPNAENKSTAAEPLAERPSLSELTPAELGPVSCSVLVAEDSLVLQVMVRQLLEKLGCEVEIVSNGKEAIAALSNKSYNLVLMDWQMPEMDGLEATRLIRTMEKQTGKHVPIIAMTANAMQGDKNRCLEAGMNGYLSKPFKIEDLKSIIKEYTNPPVQQKPES